MFGVYRTVLALAVAAAHLGGLQTGAYYAVFGFFILSGYLMTLILRQTYGYSKTGFLKYALNRTLRIYPPYWTATILSALLVALLGRKMVAAYHHTIYLPDTWQSVLQNFFLVFGYMSQPRLVPPAWALSVELIFYLGIGLGLSRTKSTTVVWFALSVIYTLLINILHASFDVKYYGIPAASLPFSTGALIYHFRESILQRLPVLAGAGSPLALFGLLVLEVALALKLHAYLTWGFYVSYALNALLIVSLLDRKSMPLISKAVDSIIGDFSYPIYLVHYLAGMVLVTAGFKAAKRGEALFFFAALPVILILAWAITRLVEWPVEAIRQRVKTRRNPR
jgi:peptidoglycan/LPS O-acetylase OafA/YrhL